MTPTEFAAIAALEAAKADRSTTHNRRRAWGSLLAEARVVVGTKTAPRGRQRAYDRERIIELLKTHSAAEVAQIVGCGVATVYRVGKNAAE